MTEYQEFWMKKIYYSKYINVTINKIIYSQKEFFYYTKKEIEFTLYWTQKVGQYKLGN